MSEFSRMIDLRAIPAAPVELQASAEECAALARRFDLVAVERLAATIALDPDGPVIRANGTVSAAIIQRCAVSGEDLPVTIAEPVSLRFVPEREATSADEEIELSADELDEIGYRGTAFDLGEAVAQSLALAIDPYATGPAAQAARTAAGLGSDAGGGAFAGLAALKDKFTGGGTE